MGVSSIGLKNVSRWTRPRAALLVGAAVGTLLAVQVEAQTSTSVNPLQGFNTPTHAAPTVELPTGMGENPDTAMRVLLEQASYWLAQYRPDRAVESLSRMLLLDKDNADALAMLAPIQAELGRAEAASQTLAHLRALRPNDPRVASMEQSLRMGEIDQALLAQARLLASQGRASEAIKVYQRVFKGDTPLPGMALEYYQILGGSEGGFDQARDELARLVTRNPQDLRAQLAFAQIQTFRESTRLEGIKRLEVLVARPAVAEQANRALKDALLWLPNDPASVASLNAYISINPTDTDLQAKLEVSRNSPGKTRQDGFDALDNNRLADAETQFLKALAINPNDKDALGGLGLVRQRQGRLPEARDLLSRAAQIDPAWEAAFGGANHESSHTGGGRDGNGAGQAIAAQYARVNTLAREGQAAKAEALLARLMGRNGNWGNYLQIGALQERQGKLAEAESSFRRAMRMNPRNSAATVGLAGLLERENRSEEARELLAKVGDVPGARGVAPSRAAEWRQRAQAETDPARRVPLLQEAVAADPSFPWTRLELARALNAQNQHPQAQQVMNATTGAHPTKDQVQAALIYAREQGDFARAAQLIELVPAKALS